MTGRAAGAAVRPKRENPDRRSSANIVGWACGPALRYPSAATRSTEYTPEMRESERMTSFS